MERADGRHDESERAPTAIAAAAFDRARAFLGSRRLGDLSEEVVRLGEVWTLCERCVANGDAGTASGLYGLLAGFATRPCGEPMSVGFWPGTVALYLGLLAATAGQAEVAAGHLEEALRAAATIGAGVQAARAQLAHARVLLARGAPGTRRGRIACSPTCWPACRRRRRRRHRTTPPRGYAFRREGSTGRWRRPGGWRACPGAARLRVHRRAAASSAPRRVRRRADAGGGAASRAAVGARGRRARIAARDERHRRGAPRLPGPTRLPRVRWRNCSPNRPPPSATTTPAASPRCSASWRC
ncbi:MAG: hypothetical protein U0802_20320 [Candidatus Binatia bacterium]